MKWFFVWTLMLGQFPNFFGFPLEAERPADKPPQTTIYIAIDKDEYSQHLKMELTKNWKDEQFPSRDKTKETQEQHNKNSRAFYDMKYDMLRLNKEIRRRVNLEIIEDISELPHKCPAFRIGKNSKWESFPKEAFRVYTFPLKTVLYELDMWYIHDWRDLLEERRRAAYSDISNVNRGVYRVNTEILEGIYGKSCGVYAIRQVTAIYAFNGKLWEKIAVPKDGQVFIPDNEVVSIEAQNKNVKLHRAMCYISGYEIRANIYNSSTITIPTTGLNCRLLPEIFPNVELLPNPPWEPKYSFVPF